LDLGSGIGANLSRQTPQTRLGYAGGLRRSDLLVARASLTSRFQVSGVALGVVPHETEPGTDFPLPLLLRARNLDLRQTTEKLHEVLFTVPPGRPQHPMHEAHV
jgi:hypothetical protein